MGNMSGERIPELTGDTGISSPAAERIHFTQGEVFRAGRRDNNVLSACSAARGMIWKTARICDIIRLQANLKEADYDRLPYRSSQ